MVRCSEIEESGGRIIIIATPGSASISQLTGSSRMDGDLYDDDCQSDSGVSADFSNGSTFDSSAAMTNMDVAKTLPYETPIEREIRRAVQREQSLRRARGIKNVSPTTEYVEIPLKKSVLCPSLPAKSETSQGKDRQFAGKKMQQEIHAEVQREQALVKLGTVPGVYDKGTVRQLKERKQLFEAFQESKVSSGNHTPQTKGPSWATSNGPQENQENVLMPVSPSGGLSMRRGLSVDLPNQKLQQQQQHSPTSPTRTKPGGSTTSTSPRGPGFSEGNGCQVIILESNLPFLSLSPPQPVQQNHRPASLITTQRVDVIDSGATSGALRSLGSADCQEKTQREDQQVEEEEEYAEEESTLKDNPFFKLRPSSSVEKVEQDIREARERERELRRQRTSLYGAVGPAGREGGARGGRGMNRGGGQRSPSTIVPPSPSYFQPVSPAQRVTGSPAVRQSLGRLGLWPPPQAEEKPAVQLESPRQKTPLLQQWETGLVNDGLQDQNH